MTVPNCETELFDKTGVDVVALFAIVLNAYIFEVLLLNNGL